LIEEVIRVLGYARLPDTPPLAPVTARVRSETRRSLDTLRHALAVLDYHETINFSFVEERWERELAGNAAPIRVLNPIASPLAVMRSSLIGSLVNVLRLNLARKTARVRIFEAGRAFVRDAAARDGDSSVAGLRQPLRVAALAYGPAQVLQWGARERTTDFFDLKGDIELLLAPRGARFVPAAHPAMHPGRCAAVEIEGARVGFVGELHPRWRQAYELPLAPLLFELDASAFAEREIPAFVPMPRQQPAWRDLAFVVGEQVSHDALLDAIGAGPGRLVHSARLFDVYKPAAAMADVAPGERSLAVRLELLDDASTLTDERIDAEVARVIDAVCTRLGARLRA
jgi:phenylalanyl-tRNA synthetase beta chain